MKFPWRVLVPLISQSMSALFGASHLRWNNYLISSDQNGSQSCEFDRREWSPLHPSIHPQMNCCKMILNFHYFNLLSSKTEVGASYASHQRHRRSGSNILNYLRPFPITQFNLNFRLKLFTHPQCFQYYTVLRPSFSATSAIIPFQSCDCDCDWASQSVSQSVQL